MSDVHLRARKLIEAFAPSELAGYDVKVREDESAASAARLSELTQEWERIVGELNAAVDELNRGLAQTGFSFAHHEHRATMPRVVGGRSVRLLKDGRELPDRVSISMCLSRTVVVQPTGDTTLGLRRPADCLTKQLLQNCLLLVLEADRLC